MIKSFKLSLLSVLFVVIPCLVQAAFVQCDAKLALYEFEGIGFSVLNGVPVTGDRFYPLNFIRENLKLSERRISEIISQRGRVLLVGEGHSELLPFLAQREFESLIAVDPAYAFDLPPSSIDSSKFAAFKRKHSHYLVAGDGRALPPSVGRPDYYFSHLLVNNLSQADTMQVVDEAIRVVNNRGHIFIFGFDFHSMTPPLSQATLVEGEPSFSGPDFKEDILPAMKNHLDHHPSHRIQRYQFKRVEQSFRDASGYLLEIDLQ